jgi:hypothetical protein
MELLLTGSMPIVNYPYILFCDKAEFTYDGVSSTHNSHFWSEVNPPFYNQKQFSAALIQ